MWAIYLSLIIHLTVWTDWTAEYVSHHSGFIGITIIILYGRHTVYQTSAISEVCFKQHSLCRRLIGITRRTAFMVRHWSNSVLWAKLNVSLLRGDGY